MGCMASGIDRAQLGTEDSKTLAASRFAQNTCLSRIRTTLRGEHPPARDCLIGSKGGGLCQQLVGLRQALLPASFHTCSIWTVPPAAAALGRLQRGRHACLAGAWCGGGAAGPATSDRSRVAATLCGGSLLGGPRGVGRQRCGNDALMRCWICDAALQAAAGSAAGRHVYANLMRQEAVRIV